MASKASTPADKPAKKAKTGISPAAGGGLASFLTKGAPSSQAQDWFNVFNSQKVKDEEKKRAQIPKDRTCIDKFVEKNGLIKSANKKRIYTDLKDLTPRPVADFAFYVISKGRAANVRKMLKLFKETGVRPNWIVGQGETAAYIAKGAKKEEVFEGGGLCASRNMALDLAQKNGKVAVELSDDLKKFQFLESNNNEWDGPDAWTKPTEEKRNGTAGAATVCNITPVTAVRVIEACMRREGAKFGGVYPNCNHGFAYGCPPVSTSQFIVGDFIVIDPSSTVRFDEEMTLKEDYDFGAQHLHKYGKICRLNRLFVEAEHYTNAGGAVAVRNTEREQYNIGVLRRKWPGVFVNQKRENEVTMRWDWRDECLGGKKGKKTVDPLKKEEKEEKESAEDASCASSSTSKKRGAEEDTAAMVAEEKNEEEEEGEQQEQSESPCKKQKKATQTQPTESKFAADQKKEEKATKAMSLASFFKK